MLGVGQQRRPLVTDNSLQQEMLTGTMPAYGHAWKSLLIDKRLSDGAVRLYLVIDSHCRGRQNVAWPGQARLAEMMDSTERTVQRHLAELVASGWIMVQRPNRNFGNRYVVMMPRPQAVDNSVDDDGRHDRNVASDTTSVSAPIGSNRNRSNPPTPRGGVAGRRSAPAARIAPLRPEERADDFAAWYAQYPRKTKKADAMVAWRQMLPELPDRLDILQAATRHVVALARRDHPVASEWERYIPYPASFLRGARWLDLEDANAARQRPHGCAPCGSADPINTPNCPAIGWSREEECPWRTPA